MEFGFEIWREFEVFYGPNSLHSVGVIGGPIGRNVCGNSRYLTVQIASKPDGVIGEQKFEVFNSWNFHANTASNHRENGLNAIFHKVSCQILGSFSRRKQPLITGKMVWTQFFTKSLVESLKFFTPIQPSITRRMVWTRFFKVFRQILATVICKNVSCKKICVFEYLFMFCDTEQRYQMN